MLLIYHRRSSPVSFIAIMLLVMGSILVSILRARVGNRRRRSVAVALNTRGFALSASGSFDALNRDAATPFHPLFMRPGRFSTRLLAQGSIQGVEVRLIEYDRFTGQGKRRRRRTHSALAIPCPLDWPTLAMDPNSSVFLPSARETDGLVDFASIDRPFNADFSVRCQDASFAHTFFTSARRHYLAALSPNRPAIRIHQGWFVLAIDHALRAETIDTVLNRPFTFLAAEDSL